MSEGIMDVETFRSSSKDPLNIRMIVLEHIQRILRISSKEFRGGYYIERPITIANGGSYICKEYVQDSREEFSNAVDALSDTLLPYFDPDMETAEKEIQDELKKVKNECIREEGGRKKLDSNLYAENRLSIQRRLYRQLSRFLKRINYLETGISEEGM